MTVNNFVDTHEANVLNERMTKRFNRFCRETSCEDCPLSILGLEKSCDRESMIDLFVHVATAHDYDGPEDV